MLSYLMLQRGVWQLLVQVKSQSLNHQVGHILNAASRSNACQKQAIQNLTHEAD